MNTEISYSRQGDYLLPDLALPEQDHREIGVWGERRRRYLMNHHKIIYYNLLTSCKLHDHLADVNEVATEMFSCLVKLFAEQEGVNERLKDEKQMLWVQRINIIQNKAIEIVNKELIFA